jgi:hypothetical protein
MNLPFRVCVADVATEYCRYYPDDRYCQILKNCARQQLGPKVCFLKKSYCFSFFFFTARWGGSPKFLFLLYHSTNMERLANLIVLVSLFAGCFFKIRFAGQKSVPSTVIGAAAWCRRVCRARWCRSTRRRCHSHSRSHCRSRRLRRQCEAGPGDTHVSVRSIPVVALPIG